MAISAVSGVWGALYGTNTNYAANMASLIAQRSQITNGSYARLLRAYVKKVGNKAALDAYRSTGSTISSPSELDGESSSSSSVINTPKKTIPRSTFLDDHLKSISKTAVSSTTAAGKSFLDKHLKGVEGTPQTGLERAVAYAEEKTGRAINAKGEFVDLADKYKGDTVTPTEGSGTNTASANDRYAAMRSTWLDDHLKSYTRNAIVQTAANYSVAVDVAV